MSETIRPGGPGRNPFPRAADNAPTSAEQHLGDRLAALVDGELGHDSRERVLAHLATCRSCKVEADAQRRLKSVFADAAPPPPSDGLLARLQGLPAADGEGLNPPGSPGGDGPGGGVLRDLLAARGAPRRRGKPGAEESHFGGATPFGAPADSQGPAFERLPGGRDGHSALTPSSGFRVHEPERSSPWRHRRFAFAAAGAVSVAALALGGAFGSGANSAPPVAAGDGGGSAVGKPRTAANGTGADRDGRRRGTGGEQSGGSASLEVATGGVSGVPLHAVRPAAAPAAPQSRIAHAYPLLRDAMFAPPLIRAARPSFPSTAPDDTLPGEAPQRRTSVTTALPSSPLAPGTTARP